MLNNLLVLADSPESFRDLIRATLIELLPPALLQPAVAAPSDSLLTITEACREFGISKTTLTEWKKKGIVPFIRLGRRVYFERAAILDAGRTHQRYQQTRKRG
ncbi:helix-turn-helix domain-containing protein [Hymenobacter sp. BT175]|uniref:helix-turn-helix domain-containing protein n=1 Tax=Hymenobacter translucens TaxID=2886507 RepID=UPI001D0EC232|nr:helix-turn-helix domain-containing protein [Hymenobacter translucens]MCC2545473.1 helix-turn-helix domain-containing protein [Hymenobacter translucens]